MSEEKIKKPTKSGPRSKEKEGKTSAPEVVREGGQDVGLMEETTTYVPRLKKRYLDVIRPLLKNKFAYKNDMQIPSIEKIVINMGIGEAVNDTKKVKAAAADLALIAGQKPVVTRARKAISSFKVRENMPIGAKVVLRKNVMYEFLDRLLTIALPRVRDFRGLNPRSFDGYGNYAFGLKEHIVFPEIDYDKVEDVCGMDIIICTTTSKDEEARALLRAFDFPFPPED